ncbi:MAG: DDE-type integrase/transposase/recombinase [Proteobacteria bacterium]|nr:DDE-type integrase/transposase/recombinase [Pseudomonadota bacterium]
MDFAGPFQGKMILVVIDSHSKWIEAYPTDSSTSSKVIELSRTLFAQFGLPEVLVTDNGSCFVSEEFETFLSKNGIKHVTSAPFHPATNGLAERAVQIVKKGLKKEKGGTMASRLAKVLMAYRTTPQSTTGVSPSELLQGRRIRTRLDLLKPNVTERVEQSQLKQKLSHDSTARRMQFSKGETVYAQNFGTGQKWMPAIFQDVTGPVSFLVKLEDDRLIRRHQDHLRRRVTDNDNNENPVEIDDIPEILIDSIAIEPNTPATESSGQGGLTTRNTQESTTDPGTPGPNGPTPESTPGTTAGGAIAQNAKGNSKAPKTYPKRQRKQPDWYHDH